MAEIVGAELAAQVRDVAIRALQRGGRRIALTKGIIIADTKFEFGLDADGTLTLMDEVLTPDSSRFWPVEGYARGRRNPPSYDKQFVRDWLEACASTAGPGTRRRRRRAAGRRDREDRAKYREALQRLTA